MSAKILCEKYVTSKTISDMETQIYIFGICKEADSIIEKCGIGKVYKFLDNRKAEAAHSYRGVEVIKPEKMLSDESKLPVVIASARYSNEMIKQLEGMGFKPGIDCFIWDDDNVFHLDDSTARFINHLKKVWNNTKAVGAEKEILIPIDNVHTSVIIKHAYMSNYLSEKYNAKVKAYCNFSFSRKNLSPIIQRIYEAFNVVDFIDESLSKEMEEEVTKLVDDIWEQLFSWEDWKRINIYGIHFGTTMLRDFFRSSIPADNIRDKQMYYFLKKTVKTIVFWKTYFEKHNIVAVLMSDGTHWGGYIRDIAISFGVPAYVDGYQLKRLTLDYSELYMYQFFDKMWEQLSYNEKKFGTIWAKERIKKRIEGDTSDVALLDKRNYVFKQFEKKQRVLKLSDKMKVLICPHSFNEDSYWYGEHLFADNYYSWLCHLGKLSDKYVNYEWYFKPHPASTDRDRIIYDKILKKYTNIIAIPALISPIQLKKEGMRYAFTESGTIGHEYPAIGIDVINAGLNPHSKFNFCFNPKTKEEFDNIVDKLPELETRTKSEELYHFYALKYLYYDFEVIPFKTFFFDNIKLAASPKELLAMGLRTGTWLYDEYLDGFNKEHHDEILKEMDMLFEKMDEWRPDVLYKRSAEDISNDLRYF